MKKHEKTFDFLVDIASAKNFKLKPMLMKHRVGNYTYCAARDLGLIKSVGYGKQQLWNWVSEKPDINTAVAVDEKKSEMHNFYNKKMHLKTQLEIKEPEPQKTEQAAITLLKGLGYRIQKPVTEYVEV